MSPRGASSAGASSTTSNARNNSAPYSRRPSSQPKSSRQQFSACGACRMRRVRCDLKDLPIATAGPNPTCSNCKERGIKCVDEFADVKAVKLLRRGRRLQQVEQIYGKVAGADGGSSTTSLSPAARLRSAVPALQPEFFTSSFWHWFSLHRPLLDPAEFPARFYAHAKGTQSLGNEGGILVMLLAVWAASFGLNECGKSVVHESRSSTLGDTNHHIKKESSINTIPNPTESFTECDRRDTKEKTEVMLREVLELVDFHGVMRKPTLDGVRVLLLLLPLLDDFQSLERLAIWECTLSQVRALCTIEASLDPSSSNQACLPGFDETTIRTRIFWYAFAQESILTGMRGGRFVLTDEDLEAFQSACPSNSLVTLNGHRASPSSGLDGPSKMGSSSTQTKALLLPVHLGVVCRKVHTVLTGHKATRRAEEHGLIDAHGMQDIWQELDRCWNEFDVMRHDTHDTDDLFHQSTTKFTGGWQIFIFECHNVIREFLKQCMTTTPTQVSYPRAVSPSRPSSHSSNSSPYLSPHHLYAISHRKCSNLLPRVVRIMDYYLNSVDRESALGLFRWDTGLVRDGCFFAGYLAASTEGDVLDLCLDDRQPKTEDFNDLSGPLTAEDGLSICLMALNVMNWAYSKSEERVETLRLVWDNRKRTRQDTLYEDQAEFPHVYRHTSLQTSYEQKSIHHLSALPRSASRAVAPTSRGYNRPLLPPLSLFDSPRRPDSAPTTACSLDGSTANGWPSYTPPGTSSTTSTGTGISARGSPVFNHMPTYKVDHEDTFYHGAGDLDQFSFNAPVTTTIPISTSPNTHYLYTMSGTPVIGHTASDYHACPQFGENCSASPYH